jgi:uncharacterized protein (TIGR02118 family)
MVKVVLVIKFRTDMDPAEASRYWAEIHGPISRAIPGQVKYVQNHTTADLFGGVPFDGVSELWFEDQTAFERAVLTPAWAAAFADGPNFLDMERCAGAVVDERQY